MRVFRYPAAGVPVRPIAAFLAELKPHLPWFQPHVSADAQSSSSAVPGASGHHAHSAKTNAHHSSPNPQTSAKPNGGGGGDDWFVSLQTEGASAVWAATDLLLQAQHADHASLAASPRTTVAVGACSYHGPPSSSLGGGASPLAGHKRGQVVYPVPSSLRPRHPAEPQEAYEVGAEVDRAKKERPGRLRRARLLTFLL